MIEKKKTSVRKRRGSNNTPGSTAPRPRHRSSALVRVLGAQARRGVSPPSRASRPLHRRFVAPPVRLVSKSTAALMLAAAALTIAATALSRLGWRVLRLDAVLVMNDLRAAVALVKQALV